MRCPLVVCLLVSLCLFPACHTAGSPAASELAPGVVALDDVTHGLAGASTKPGALDAGLPEPGQRPAANPSGANTNERLLIQRGEIRVEVARPEDAVRDFLAQVKEWGGYLAAQQGMTVTVRVPAAAFDGAFAAVRATGRVLGESREANDVTE